MDASSPLEPEPTLEEKLARERAVLQYVVDNIPYLIFWKDRQSVFLGCNKNFAALDGRDDPAEMVGRTDHDASWAEHADEYRAGDLATMERGEPILNMEETLSDGKGGEQTILTSKVPLRDEDGEVIGILGIIVDITERKQLEIDLKKAKEEAEQAARAKSEFIANITHELRTPLTLILGPVRKKLQDPSLSNGTRQLLERIQRNGFRLFTLVNDVLDLSKAEAGRTVVCRELFEAVAMTRSILDDLRPLAESQGLDLQLSTEIESLTLALDPRFFERILLNLVGNALKFTPAGGKVLVRLSLEERNLRIDVIDNGVGIPQEAQDRLFQKFVQVDSSVTRKHEGSGIGLSLVKHFSEAMDGSVSFASEVGKGSTFTVLLPARSPGDETIPSHRPSEDSFYGPADQSRLAAAWVKPSTAPAPEPESVGTGDQRPRILVAEDNPDLRWFIAETLADDFSVVVVENGLRAWESLREQSFDVVISDVMMPELDGLELTAKIKSHAALRNLPVILLTAITGTEATAAGLEAGADDYVVKPFVAEELRARARSAIRLKRLHDEQRGTAHRAGMASVAANVLHNLGNVLNSMKVSSALLKDKTCRLRVKSVRNLADLLAERSDDLAGFLTADERGQRVPEYLSQLADYFVEEQADLAGELDELQKKLEHMEFIVSSHREISGEALSDLLAPAELMETALRLVSSAVKDGEIQIEKKLGNVPLIRGDRHKVLQILVNLLHNAHQALGSSDRDDKKLTVATEQVSGMARFVVSDNGIGIAPDIEQNIFMQGFTTKPEGQGLGLHSSALLARELEGRLSFDSQGSGQAATFILDLPIAVAEDQSEESMDRT